MLVGSHCGDSGELPKPRSKIARFQTGKGVDLKMTVLLQEQCPSFPKSNTTNLEMKYFEDKIAGYSKQA